MTSTTAPLWFAVIIAAALCSCIQTNVKKLPSHTVAAAMGGPEVPRIFFEHEIDWSDLPSAVPIEVIGMSSNSEHKPGGFASHLADMPFDCAPDFVLIGSSSTFYAGSTYQYIGYGAGLSFPTYGTRLSAVAYRACPSRLGVGWNESLMVTTISNPSVREAGLQEGDFVVSIAGAAVSRAEYSPHKKPWLSIQVGDEVPMVWIRPGTGRMEGTGIAMANPPIHLGLVDAMDVLKAQRLEVERRQRGTLLKSPPKAN